MKTDNENDVTDDPLSGPAFGPLLIEKMLAAVMVANPKIPVSEVRKRLDKCMMLLLGQKSSPNPFPFEPKYKDEQALLWMASQQKRHLGFETKATSAAIFGSSITKLASRAVKKFFPSTNENYEAAKTKDLAEKFTGTYSKKLKRDAPVGMIDIMRYQVSYHDYIRESVQEQVLTRIRKDLKDFDGINTDLEKLL